jgi:hypothetical protein
VHALHFHSFPTNQEFSPVTKTAFLLTLIVTALASMPAHAQVRTFVASFGADTNPCTVTAPCRSFQHAHDTAPANSEIEVVDPAGYGPLTINHGISIQGHGFAGITQTSPSGVAITINVITADPVTLNGLLIDGGGTGSNGIRIDSGSSVQILNSVVRHFAAGIFNATSTSGSDLLVEDTVASDNVGTGIVVNPSGGTVKATLNRITANHNKFGVVTTSSNVTIANSVMSNNSNSGLESATGGIAWLAKNVISGNGTGVLVSGGTVNSYGDNYIRDNTTPVSGGVLTPVTTQ